MKHTEYFRRHFDLYGFPPLSLSGYRRLINIILLEAKIEEASLLYNQTNETIFLREWWLNEHKLKDLTDLLPPEMLVYDIKLME